MNKKYLKLISWVLVFTMLIFDTAGLPVFRKAMVYSASVMSESEVEAEQEAFEDSISIVSAGNWGISRYVDNLSWGFFHYEVQKHIIKKYDPKIKKEQEIIFSKNKKGRADLAEEITDPKSSNYGLTYLWEVKPYSYSVDPKKTKGENQLKGYVGTKDYYRIGNTDGVNIEADSFTVVISEKISYNITYEPAKSGLILYKFKRINVDDNKYPPTAFDYFSTYKKNSLDFSKQEVADEYKNNEQKHIEYDEGWLGKVAIKIILTIATVATAYYTVDNYSSISASVKNLAAKFVANKTPEAAAEFMASISIFIEDDPILKGKIYNELFEEGYTKQEIDNIMEEIQSYSADMDTATSAQPPRDPLAIDLGASGIKLTSLANGVNFDLDNNNFAEKTAWIGNEDGFLALDRNGDGIINNGGELFGDRVLMSDGEISKSGFEALADLNINDDNVIDNNDEVFDNLIVWFDENQDGISQNEELKSLEEMNIISISLNVTKESNIDTETGTMEAEYAMVTFSNGNQSRISEFWFPVNSADTTQNGIKTSGNIPSIAQAIESDETGILDELCACFARAEDIKIKRYYLKQILYFISGAIDLEPGSRGGNIDARDLKVIEEFMGREFVGVGGANPNSPAAEILKKISTDIENNYYNILNLHAGLGGYLISVYETTDENGTKILETELLDYIIEDKIAAGENVDVLIYDLGVYLKNFDSRNQSSNFEKYKTHYSAISEHYAEIVKLSESANTYIGTDKNDVFNGTNNNDFVFGKSNNDTLRGGNGSNILDGGLGDDTLIGGSGDDRYIFGANHGNDVVDDNSGLNSLIFNDEVTAADYSISLNETRDLVLTNGSDGNSVTVKDYLNRLFNYKFQFEGVSQSLGGSDSEDLINGSENDDIIETGNGLNIVMANSGNDNIYGGEDIDIIFAGSGDDRIFSRNGTNIVLGEDGNDTIYDGDHNGFLYGDSGDDVIYAGGGDDTLEGGNGNDDLQGDHGNDTYYFKKGYGQDVIYDSSDDNIIKISGFSANEMINTKNANNDLIINFENSEDSLTVKEFFNYNSNRNFTFIFDNGTTLGQYDITAKYAPIYGTENGEWLSASGNDGVEIYGLGGNDGLQGTNGNDILDGGDGNDTLSGNEGSDSLDGGFGNDDLQGGGGNDTYIFGKNYGQDVVNDWGGNSVVIFKDLKSTDVTITSLYGSALVFTVNGTEDKLTINNFKWSQGNYEFQFADGGVGTVDKNTFEMQYSVLPTIPEEVADENVTETLDETIVTETENVVETSDETIVTETENAVEISDENTTTESEISNENLTETTATE